MTDLNLWDRFVGWFSPEARFKRLQYRRASAAYEAAQPSRLRTTQADNSSGDGLMETAGSTLRGYARQLEQNYDIAKGALDVLENHCIGPNGITLEPMPRDTEGNVHREFAQQLMELWKDWTLLPEVTREHDWNQVQRLAFRTMIRDGEELTQMLQGRIPSLQHGTRVPLSLELIEADQLPFDVNQWTQAGLGGNRITHGVERNAWGRVMAYHLLKDHPGDPSFHMTLDTKRVPSERMLHPKIVHRIRQARGVSIFAAALRRLEDLKDYEESERIAARVAAALTGYIKSGTVEDYTPPEGGQQDRSFSMKPGMIFDGLRPGEEVGTIDSNRPSGLLTDFRNGMVKAFAAGIGTGYSTISRNYDGSYSAQRQELVENWPNYQKLTAQFVSQFNRPIWHAFVRMAIASGAVQVPDDLDRNTMMRADYRGPAMPWIDPSKEAAANKMLERSGYKSAQQIIRERGGDPGETMDQIAEWRDDANQRDLFFDSDPAKTASSGSAQDLELIRTLDDSNGDE